MSNTDDEPIQFKNNYPDDKEWTAGVELLNEWTHAETQLRHIVQAVRSGEFRPAHFYTDLIEQYITTALKQQLKDVETNVVLGWYKYPSKALEGDTDYEIAKAINADRTRARQALKDTEEAL